MEASGAMWSISSHLEAPMRHPGGTRRQPRGSQEAPRRHAGGILKGTQETHRATQKAPRGAQETPRGPWATGKQNVKKAYTFLSRDARATTSHESGEGDPHDLRCLRTKVDCRTLRSSPTPPGTGPKRNRQNPSRQSLFGDLFSPPPRSDRIQTIAVQLRTSTGARAQGPDVRGQRPET